MSCAVPSLPPSPDRMGGVGGVVWLGGWGGGRFTASRRTRWAHLLDPPHPQGGGRNDLCPRFR